jgi:peroxiredoxin
MNRFIRCALIAAATLTLTVAMSAASLADPLALGTTAPMGDTPMKNVDGKDVTLDGVKGSKGTLVVFSCNACPWAKAWEERIVELGNSFAKRGLGVVVINPNDPSVSPEDGFDVMVARAKERKMAFPYVLDATSEVARAFGATRTPEAFLFDAKGKLVYHGAVDDNAKEPRKVEKRWLRDAMDAVVAGKNVPVSETKAFGCSIKFRKQTS